MSKITRTDEKTWWNVERMAELGAKARLVLEQAQQTEQLVLTTLSEQEEKLLPVFLKKLKTCHDIWERSKIFLEWQQELVKDILVKFKFYTYNIDLILTNTTCLPLEELAETLVVANKVWIDIIKFLLFTLKIKNIEWLKDALNKLSLLDYKILKDINFRYWTAWIKSLLELEYMQIEQIRDWKLNYDKIIEFYLATNNK